MSSYTRPNKKIIRKDELLVYVNLSDVENFVLRVTVCVLALVLLLLSSKAKSTNANTLLGKADTPLTPEVELINGCLIVRASCLDMDNKQFVSDLSDSGIKVV